MDDRIWMSAYGRAFMDDRIWVSAYAERVRGAPKVHVTKCARDQMCT